MKAKTYSNQQVGQVLDKYIKKYYANSCAAMGKAEGIDASYLSKMRYDKTPVHGRLLPLLGFVRIAPGVYKKSA